MKTWRGRPEIEFGDHPKTVYAALERSVPFLHPELVGWLATAWVNTVQDSKETLMDSYGLGVSYPGIELEELRPPALLRMSLSSLELALVNYGCEKLEDGETPDVIAEVANVDELLLSIDANR